MHPMRMSLEKGVGLRREDSPGKWVALLSEMGPGLNGRENRTLLERQHPQLRSNCGCNMTTCEPVCSCHRADPTIMGFIPKL